MTGDDFTEADVDELTGTGEWGMGAWCLEVWTDRNLSEDELSQLDRELRAALLLWGATLPGLIPSGVWIVRMKATVS